MDQYGIKQPQLNQFSQSATACRPSEVSEQVSRLSAGIAMASSLLDDLEQRLSSVYRGAPVDDSKGGINGSHPEPVLVPLAGDLRNLGRSLDTANNRLQAILNGVEL
jgi:hypothetical protein